jgi:hypothetical protein
VRPAHPATFDRMAAVLDLRGVAGGLSIVPG